MSEKALRLKQAKLQHLQAEKERRECLPHLYSQHHYWWSKKFFDDVTSKRKFLCAGNQIGKSTTQIKQMIEVCTNPERRKAIYGDGWENARLYFYFYPDKATATREFRDKIKPLLPKKAIGEKDANYRWRSTTENSKYIESIIFGDEENEIVVQFLFYSKSAMSLQASSPAGIWCDEELPYVLWPEISMRIASPLNMNGKAFFSMAFTATIGQQEWKDVIEGDSMPDALKVQVSMYDCLEYVDTDEKSPWTKKRIKEIESTLTPREIEKRVYGKFVLDGGLKYPNFDRSRNYKKGHKINKSWGWYAGLDYGSGGRTGHPSAITLMRCDPDFTQGRIVDTWRGDLEETTAEDVILKYVEMCKLHGILQADRCFYDWSAKDLATIASRIGLNIEKAEKGHDIGESTMNALLKTGQLIVYEDDETDNEKLVKEFENLQRDTDKKKAKDDLLDSARYCVTKLPWIFQTKINEAPPTQPRRMREGRHEWEEKELDLGESIEEEIGEWNELMDC